MKNARLTLVKNATDPSKTNEDSMPTTTPFMLRNPFKTVDWLLVGIVAMLAGGAILFVLAMRLISSS